MIYDCDISTEDLDPKTLTGEPNIAPEACGNFYTSYSDDVYKTCENQYTIVRDWTILDWCQGEVYQHKQEIRLACSAVPLAHCIESLFVSLSAGQTILEASDFDSGSYDLCGLDLAFSISINGAPFVDSYNVECTDLGSHKVVFKVENLAGSIAYCEVELNVEDKAGHCSNQAQTVRYSDKDQMVVQSLQTTPALKSGTVASAVAIYPNPTVDILYISMNKVFSGAYVHVYDGSGQLVKAVHDIDEGIANLSIDVSESATGSNLLLVEIYDGIRSTCEKVIVIR